MNLESPATYHEDVLRQIDNFAKSFKEDSPLLFESFLLDAKSPYVLQCPSSEHLEETCGKELWPSVHNECFRRIGVARPSAENLRAFAKSVPSVGMRQWLVAHAGL